jgi:NarL family two-component system sensor histidine kinase LiaS
MGLEVISEQPDDLKLSAEIEREIYFVLREALTNVTRHSHASQVEIRLKQKVDGLEVFLNDNGVGFERNSVINGRSFGLSAMEERIKKTGGELFIKSTPGQGTNVSFFIPLAALNGTELHLGHPAWNGGRRYEISVPALLGNVLNSREIILSAFFRKLD